MLVTTRDVARSVGKLLKILRGPKVCKAGFEALNRGQHVRSMLPHMDLLNVICVSHNDALRAKLVCEEILR